MSYQSVPNYTCLATHMKHLPFLVLFEKKNLPFLVFLILGLLLTCQMDMLFYHHILFAASERVCLIQRNNEPVRPGRLGRQHGRRPAGIKVRPHHRLIDHLFLS